MVTSFNPLWSLLVAVHNCTHIRMLLSVNRACSCTPLQELLYMATLILLILSVVHNMNPHPTKIFLTAHLNTEFHTLFVCTVIICLHTKFHIFIHM